MYDLVLHRPAVQRMGVADDADDPGRRSRGGILDARLEWPGRPVDEGRLGCRRPEFLLHARLRGQIPAVCQNRG
jgi:hypothetical protein